jgi:hypothetical protein
MQQRPSVKKLLADEKEVNEGSPRRSRRVARTHAVTEKQKYLVVPCGNERGIRERGQIVLSHFDFKTHTKSFRTVIKSKPDNRNVKIHYLTANPMYEPLAREAQSSSTCFK